MPPSHGPVWPGCLPEPQEVDITAVLRRTRVEHQPEVPLALQMAQHSGREARRSSAIVLPNGQARRKITL